LSVWKESGVSVKGSLRETGDGPTHDEPPIRVAAIGTVWVGAEVVCHQPHS
jgi:hypothetical protein